MSQATIPVDLLLETLRNHAAQQRRLGLNGNAAGLREAIEVVERLAAEDAPPPRQDGAGDAIAPVATSLAAGTPATA